MNDFLRDLNPTASKLGLLRIVERTCGKHGSFNARVYGFTTEQGEDVVGETGCDLCRDEADRLQVVENYHFGKIAGRTGEAGIPAKFASCTLNGFVCKDDHMKTVRDWCVGFIRGEIRSVILCGPTERGKTHLMAASLKGCVTMGKSALYVTESKLFRQIKESNSGRRDVPSGSQLIDRYSDCQVLGIDEVGRSSWTEYEALILGEIVANRDNNGGQTMIATNLLPHELHPQPNRRGYFDDAVFRKLGAIEIVTTWERFHKETNL